MESDLCTENGVVLGVVNDAANGGEDGGSRKNGRGEEE
jgi:hypothetical protein